MQIGARYNARDIAAHLVLYAALAFALARALRFRRVTIGRAVLGAIIAATVFGVLDEWHQAFIPGRGPSLADAITDGVGATFGALAYRLVRASQHSRP